jgi:hypothetical protein
VNTEQEEDGPPEVLIDGFGYVPFKALDVTINGMKYVPQTIPDDVVIDGVNYVQEARSNDLDVVISGRRYVPWSNWRPIETAPQGGVWLLLWWPDANPFGPTAGYHGTSGWRAANGAWWADGPTHWMPLPPRSKA